ncbi:MAG: lysozyme [Jatrophihabitans sp.]
MTSPNPVPTTLNTTSRPRRRTVMIGLSLLGAAAVAGALLAPSGAGAVAKTSQPGIDVSHYQGSINWSKVRAGGVKFAYIKATEGTGYRDPKFNANYAGATEAGIIRGGYHFARPDLSSGTTQAKYFLAHGGGWSSDGRTLPGLLDLENEGSHPFCYGLSPSKMVSWLISFNTYYHAHTGVYPVFYTRTNWWNPCTGNSRSFANKNPLFIARYGSSAGTLPAGWSFYTFWQYADHGSQPGDADKFNGSYARLQALAKG